MNPRDILRHELIGLFVEVVDAKNPYLKGIKGRVIDETRNLLIVEKENGKIVKIPKDICVFIFHLDKCKVKVLGELLIGRPEERLKKKFKIIYPY